MFILLGQPEQSNPLSLELSPGALKRGFRKVARGGKNVFANLEEASSFNTKQFNDVRKADDTNDVLSENFSLAGETTPLAQPRIDVYSNSVTGGGDVFQQLQAQAFETDVNNRITSLRLSEPEVIREPIADNAFLWTGDYKGRQAIQSNPFVKLTIVNPSQLHGGLNLEDE